MVMVANSSSIHRLTAVLCAGLASLACLGMAHAQDPNDPDYLANKAAAGELPAHMPESLRESIGKLIVHFGDRVADDAVSGTYGKSTAGVAGGMAAGSRVGNIAREIGGVPVYIPIPGLQIPGAILGALAGATQRELQEFRDALTEELVESDSPPLRSDGLANDVFWDVRRLPGIDSHLFSPSVEVPEDADAVLYVNFDDLAIQIQGRDAIISTSALATLHNPADGRDVYQTTVIYEDRDSLRNWTANDNELWRRYANFARYYLGNAIADDVFGRVELAHSLTPVETKTAKAAKKEPGRFVSQSTTPTLAWQLALEGGDSYGGWSSTIDASAIAWDIEVFDDSQLVYDAQQIADPEHTLAWEIEACKTYRWSVRPAYSVNGQVRFGDWMRLGDASENDDDADKKSKRRKKGEVLTVAEQAIDAGKFKGLVGRKASVAPAYTQDFPSLEIACPR